MKGTLLLFITVILLVFPILSIGQVYNKRMDEAIALGDTSQQRKVLREWQFEWPTDPDMWLAHAKFYQQKGALEGDSSIKSNYLSEAYSSINKAKHDFPNRLDIRLALISVLNDVGDYDAYTTEILELLDVHDELKEDWLWRNNNKLTGLDDFVQQYVDMYTLLLYNKKDKTLHPKMDMISNRLLHLFPKHIPALLSLSINALHRNDYQTAIDKLQRAKQIDTTNTSILDNLAIAYERDGKRERAIDIYKEILEFGNAEERDYATRKIKELSNRR